MNFIFDLNSKEFISLANITIENDENNLTGIIYIISINSITSKNSYYIYYVIYNNSLNDNIYIYVIYIYMLASSLLQSWATNIPNHLSSLNKSINKTSITLNKKAKIISSERKSSSSR